MADVRIERRSRHGQGTTLFSRIWRNRMSYVLLLPAVVATAIFCYWPMYGVTLAFKDYKLSRGILGSDWADPWYKWFRLMFRDKDFFVALWNTVVISGMKLITSTFACILLALLLNEVRNQAFKRTVQTLSYLPHFLSWVVIASVMYSMFSASFGAVNKITEAAFGFKITPFSDPSIFRPTLYLTSIWKGVGFGSIIYLAAISGISPELYEAAIIDGASRFQRVIHITLAGIRSTIVLLLILDVGGLMNAGFDQIFNLYAPQTYATGDIIDTFVYRRGVVHGDYSFSAAIGLFKQVINIILLLTVNQIAKALGEEGVL